METETTSAAVPPTLRHLRNEVTDIEKRTRAFASEHPLATLGAAVAFGFLLGRTLSRGLRGLR